MNATNTKSTVLRWIAFITVSLPTAAMIIYGIVMLFKGYILTLSLLLMFFCVPIIFIAIFFSAIRDNMCVAGKIAVCVLFYIVLFFVVVVFILFGDYRQKITYVNERAVEKYSVKYEAYLKDISALPAVSDLGTYEKIEYHQYENRMFLADPHAEVIICKYDSANYESEKAKVENTYVFQSDPIGNTETEVTVDGYYFRLSDIEYYTYSIKDVGFIATNDSTHEIAYLFFCDVERDNIAPLKDFILVDCGWKYIR